MTFFEKVKFLFRFFIRALLLAIFILFLIIFLLFLVNLIDFVYNIHSGREKSPLFNAYIIVSPSMVPTIQVQDAIVIRRVTDDDLEIGSIITFSSTSSVYPGLTVTHRIVGKQMSQSGKYVYRTKGDNNSREDYSLLTIDDIYGKVILKIPKLGYIQKFLTTSTGAFLFIILPASVIVVYDFFKFFMVIFRKKLNKAGKSENS